MGLFDFFKKKQVESPMPIETPLMKAQRLTVEFVPELDERAYKHRSLAISMGNERCGRAIYIAFTSKDYKKSVEILKTIADSYPIISIIVGYQYQNQGDLYCARFFKMAADDGNAEGAMELSYFMGHTDAYKIDGTDKTWYQYTIQAAKGDAQRRCLNLASYISQRLTISRLSIGIF